MRNFNLSENGVTVIRQDNTAHGIQQHLQHGFGT
jgi:hypothetical protein